MVKYTTHLGRLTKLQKALNEQNYIALPNQFRAMKYHYSTIGYTALILSICLIGYVTAKMKSETTIAADTTTSFNVI